MAEEKKAVGIIVKNNIMLNFLKVFFSQRGKYSPTFFSNTETFLNEIAKKPPSLVIVESAFIKSIHDKIANIPKVAMINGDIENGIQTAINHNVKNYLYKPYLDIDLEHKIEFSITDVQFRSNMGAKIKELGSVIDLTRIISSTIDPQQILYTIVSKIAELIPVTRCSVIRIDSLNKSALVVATFEDPNLKTIKLNLCKYPEIREALKLKKTVIIKDVLTDPLMQEVKDIISPLGIRSILVIPIFYNSKLIGTLFLRTSKSGHSFTEYEIRLINAFSEAASIPLHNAFMFEQIKNEKTMLDKLAVTDYLTGIYNIRYFYHRITEEFSRCQRYSFPLSCLMVDLDGFKEVNDKYGHKVGDIVLKEFAMLLKKHSRKSDVIARYGGDEFIVLLPQTSLNGALSEANRLRKYVNNHIFTIINKIGFTLGIGVVTFPDAKVKSYNDLILFADKALYQAKKLGKNQTVVYADKEQE